MNLPVAVSVQDGPSGSVHHAALDPELASRLQPAARYAGPAIVVVSCLHLVDGLAAAVLDPADVLAVVPGDWSEALIVLVPPAPEVVPDTAGETARGDQAFLAETKVRAPDLVDLSADTLARIRARGVQGSLQREGGGRWVNRPHNCFTLKLQPRVGNLHFTLYGNPETYQAPDFLKRDQNSYSRGWVKTTGDAERLADLVALSQSRRFQ